MKVLLISINQIEKSKSVESIKPITSSSDPYRITIKTS